MVKLRLLSIVALVVLVSAVSGCCSVCNFSSAFSKGFDKSSFTLSSYEYEYKDISLNSDSTLSYTVTARGDAVNIYLLDETDFADYEENGNEWVADYYDTAAPSVSGTFSPGKAGTYYFVVENDGENDVDVTWDLKW